MNMKLRHEILVGLLAILAWTLAAHYLQPSTTYHYSVFDEPYKKPIQDRFAVIDEMQMAPPADPAVELQFSEAIRRLKNHQ